MSNLPCHPDRSVAAVLDWEIAAPPLLAVGMLRPSSRLGVPDVDLSEVCARLVEFILDD